MSVYLSVDLDYWINCNASLSDYSSFEEDMIEFFDKISKQKVKPVVVLEHNGMLPHINKSNCNTIFHVDYHSDLDVPISEFDEPYEGDFLFFVNQRQNKEYHWFLPNRECCHVKRNGHCSHANLFMKKNWLFKKQQIHEGTKNLDFKNVSHIGISLSPEWVYYGAAEEVIDRFLLNWADEKTKEEIWSWKNDYYTEFCLC